MQQITITIGRGQVGSNRLLSVARWDEFKREITSTIEAVAGYDIVASNDGTGTWTDDEGRAYSEHNHVWVALVPEQITFDETSKNAWRGILSRYADAYDQDAIAFGYGDSELVGRPTGDGGRITGTQTSVAPHEEAAA